MELPNIKELEKLLKMCRKQGITELTMQGMSFKFGDLPRDNNEPDIDSNPHGLTDEQLAFYSVDPLMQGIDQ